MKNRYGKKTRRTKWTVLIYPEGAHEDIFLKYLKTIYPPTRNVAHKLIKGKGGSADGLVVQAHKVQGAFNRRVVILDNDKGEREMQAARREAQKRSIELFEHTPCLEAVLLSLLRSGKDFSEKTTSWCKKEFESEYLDSRRRKDISEYKKLFPKPLLDSFRNKISELKRLMQLLEEG